MFIICYTGCCCQWVKLGESYMPRTYRTYKAQLQWWSGHHMLNNHWYSIFEESIALFTWAFEVNQLKEKKRKNHFCTCHDLNRSLIFQTMWFVFNYLCCCREGLHWCHHHKFYLNGIWQNWNKEELKNFLHRNLITMLHWVN